MPLKPALPDGIIHTYDLIGDPHGDAAEIKEICYLRGYTIGRDGVPVPPDGTKLILMGDLISRGNEIDEMTRIARLMEARGDAESINGNHDYNYGKLGAVFGNYPHVTRSELKKKFKFTELQLKNCMENYNACGKGRSEKKQKGLELSTWLANRPYCLRVDKLRVTHAFYDKTNIALIEEAQAFHPAAPMYIAMMEECYDTSIADAVREKNHMVLNGMKTLFPKAEEFNADLGFIASLELIYKRSMRQAVTETTKGKVYDLNKLDKLAPELTGVEKTYRDTHGVQRTEARIMPWANVEMAENIDDILVLPKTYLAGKIQNPQAVARELGRQVISSEKEDVLTVYGHYSQRKKPQITNPTSLCLDFADHVTSYRYAVGDAVFKPQNLLSIPKK